LKSLREHKHLVLFLTLAVLLGLQPVAHGRFAALIVYDLAGILLMLVIFLVVIEGRIQRTLTFMGASIAATCNWAAYALGGEGRTVAMLIHNGALVVFLAFAVVTILRGVFRRSLIRGDDVIGGLCAYLLAGLAWGNLYAFTEGLVPGSFVVKPEVAWQLAEPNTRRFLFNYFSFVTITSLGTSDLTPATPTATWLVCMEAMFGQFYVAVVVAQMVGLKLAQATHRHPPHDNS
jgi:hypothetical protein